MVGYCYDIETYKEIFTFTAINIQDRTEIHQYYIHESRNDLMDILRFINRDIYLIGYNNLSFDNTIINFITIRLQDFRSTAHIIDSIYQLANKIIDTETMYADEEVKIYRYYKPKYKTFDLFRIAYESIERKSLKQTAINLKYPRILDSPIAFDDHITNDKIPIVLDYNKEDVLVTLSLFDYLKEKIAYRFAASTTYNVDLINCNKSQIADRILVKLYSELTNQHYSQFKDLRTHHRQINVGACLDPNIKFVGYELNNLYNRFASKTIKDTHNELKEFITIDKLKFNLGTGGLHSKDYPAIFKQDEELIIRDCDVTSFYPRIVINLKIKPNHLSPLFFELCEFLVKERVDAKHRGDMIIADTLKISINSGLFGEHFAEVKVS